MKRILLITILSVVFIIVELFNWLGLIIDELLYPDYKRTGIKSPVFIVGMHRTASTYLHNTLAADKEVFTSMKLWEILFAPSIIQKKFFMIIKKLDKSLHHSLSKIVRKIDRKIYDKYNPMHPSSFFSYEEDDLILIHIFSGLFLIFLFPDKKNLNSIIRFDDNINKRSNKRIILFYKRCIQKHMYVYGENKTYLSKSPSHTSKLIYLNKYFPDSRFIYTVRPPEEVIPSAISTFINFLEIYHTPYKINSVVKGVFELADYFYSHPLLLFKNITKNRFIILLYYEFLNNLRTSILSVYDRFGITLSEKFQDYIFLQQSRQYRSSHIYSAEKYGLKTREISSRYKKNISEYQKLILNGN